MLSHVDAASPEGVDATPAARDFEQLDPSDPHRQHRIDDEVLTDRLEAKHRAEEKQRRSGRPRLRAASGRVLDRVARH